MKRYIILLFILFPTFGLAQIKQINTSSIFPKSEYLRDILELETVDFDNDGDLDIITVGGHKGPKIFINHGTYFEEKLPIVSISSFTYSSFTTADFNNDGFIDFIVVSSDNNFSPCMFFNNGDLTFQRQYLPVNSFNEYPFDKVTTMDFDNDGYPEIVAASNKFKKILYWENDTSGQMLGPFILHSDLNNLNQITAADINNDTLPDLIISANEGIYLLSHKLNEEFELSRLCDTYSNEFELLDIDNDNDLDFVIRKNNQILWYLNDGFLQFTLDSLQLNLKAETLVIGDYDNDGDYDIITDEEDANLHSILWRENDGNLNFDTKHEITSKDEFKRTISKSCDLNNDNKLDLLVIYTMSPANLIAYQQVDTSTFSTNNISSNLADLNFIHYSDIDLDGDIDIVGPSYQSSSFAWLENIGNRKYTNHTIEKEIDWTDLTHTVDIDNDGDIDIINIFHYKRGLTLMENNGENKFNSTQIGKQHDIENFVVLNTESGFKKSIVYYKGYFTGQNSFNKSLYISQHNGEQYIESIIRTPSLTSTYGSINDLAVYDFNNDSLDDLIVEKRGNTFWLKNNGNGNFEDFKVIENLSGRILPNFDDDQNLEILEKINDSVYLLDYNEKAELVSKRSFYLPAYSQLIIADLDNDGQKDIIYLSENKFHWIHIINESEYNEYIFTPQNYFSQYYNLKIDCKDIYQGGFNELIMSYLGHKTIITIELSLCDLELTIQTNKVNMCPGDSALINVSATSNVTYSMPEGMLNNAYFSPSSNTHYTISATDNYGCLAEQEIFFNIFSSPDSNLYLIGTSTLMASSGNENYTWKDCETNDMVENTGSSNIFNPSEAGNYYAEITNNSGCKINTNCIEIRSVSELEDITIYPNPTSGDLYFLVSGPISNAVIKVFDTNGVQMFTSNSSQQFNYLNVSEMPIGIYYLEVSTHDKRMIKQFTKI
jgi:hypothetical protein